MVRIIATVRTLNEEFNIEAFCKAYQFADMILVADGGSEDRTVEIAKRMPKTRVRDYDVMVECNDGIWRNPDGPHIQFLVDWAVNEKADWIIHQDCDHRPTKDAKEVVRGVLEKTGKDFLMITQIFLWCGEHYFPHLSRRGDKWMYGLWGWRSAIGIKIIDRMPHYEFSFDGKTAINPVTLRADEILAPPSGLLHFGWRSEERVSEHVDYYRKSGLIPGMQHPKDFGKKMVPLEDWMRE